jgi:hypothetical protein
MCINVVSVYFETIKKDSQTTRTKIEVQKSERVDASNRW